MGVGLRVVPAPPGRPGAGHRFDTASGVYLGEVAEEHKQRFGRRLRLSDPATELETRLAGYARLLEAHRIMETSRLGTHRPA